MEYRTLGRSGLKVSALSMGTFTFGGSGPFAMVGTQGVAEARRLVDLNIAHGVNLIDCANMYSAGLAEEILGEVLEGRRSDVLVTTKARMRMGPGPNDEGTSRHHLIRACENSLKRLRTDYIDIYYMHRDYESSLSLEEPVRAMGDLIRAGKIRYFGLSNFRGWRIAEVVRLCDQLGVPRPLMCQPYYNAMNRTPENDILPACRHYGIGVTPYSPVARGVLTGKYQPGMTPEAGSRAARGDKRIHATEFRPESLAIAQAVKQHAAARGLTAGQFATAWVLANPIITSVIPGPRTLAHWQDYFGAVDYPWTAEDEAFVDSHVAPGHPSTPGFTDQQYALTGRPAK